MLFAYLRFSLLALFLSFWLLALPSSASATTAAPTTAGLESALQTLQQVQEKIPSAQEDASLNDMRQQVIALHAQAKENVQALQPQLADLKRQLGNLGEATPEEQEPAALMEQRKALTTEIAEAENQQRLANVLLLDAERVLESIASQRRSLFQNHLWQRSPSILTGRFWSEFLQGYNLDTQRSQTLITQLRQQASAIPAPIWLALLGWSVLILAGQGRLRTRLRIMSGSQVPDGNLRRNLYAWAQTLLAVAVPFLIFGGAYLAISWFEPLPESVRAILASLIGVATYCGYLAGLGRALLSPHTPAWRLPPISDPVANALRYIPWLFAALLCISWLADQLSELVSARLSFSILAGYVQALLLLALFAFALQRIHRYRNSPSSASPASPGPSTWVARLLKRNQLLLELLFTLALVIGLIALLLGYVVFVNYMLQLLLWGLTVISTAYLLSATINSGVSVLIQNVNNRRLQQEELEDGAPFVASPAEQTAADASTPSSLKKWIVLGGGLAQASVGLLAVLLIYGALAGNSFELFGQLQQIPSHLRWGEVQISPLAIIQGIALFLLGATLIHVLKRWLAERFFPATMLDAGVQASLISLLGYAAYVALFAMALSVIGVGFERVTWIASALSVGIGFGLQAIVQNFVSGLILLAERPVKVGDWVSLSGVEGDIRRINVRATEIQMGDRSTVIVPNSELVTKMVRNITYADSLGRLQFKLTLPLGTSAPAVRDTILQVLKTQPNVLHTPEPGVSIDDITSDGIIFSATAFVSSPRLASRTRSAVLYATLEALEQAGIALSNPAEITLSRAPAAPREAAQGQKLPSSTDVSSLE